MAVLKLSYVIEGLEYQIYAPFCGMLYKYEDISVVPWPETDPYAKMNYFTCYRKNNNWIFQEDQYNEKFKNWRKALSITIRSVYNP